MLQAIMEYARKHPPKAGVEVGFAPKYAKWAIVCSAEGRPPSVVGPLGDPEEKKSRGMEFEKAPALSQGELIAGGVTKSHFLIDTADVVALFGLAPDDTSKKAENTRAKHSYFVRFLQDASTAMPELAAAAAVLSSENTLAQVRAGMTEWKVKPTDKVTLRIEGRFPVESDAWHGWWRGFRKRLSAKQEERETPSDQAEHVGAGKPARAKKAQAAQMRDFVTGEFGVPARTHDKIRGLGGSAFGDALVSFDKDAFCSYGLEQSHNAAMSDENAKTYTVTLNRLIQDQSRDLVGAKVVCWYTKTVPKEDDAIGLLLFGEESEESKERSALAYARQMLESIHTGKRPHLYDCHYCALTLSGAEARVMVRDWMEGQFETLLRNLIQWQDELEIINYFGTKPVNEPGIERVTKALLPLRKPNQDYKDWIKPVGAFRLALWHAAIRGDAIPFSVVARLVELDTKFRVSGELEDAPNDERARSNRTAQLLSLLYTRMALMKAYWVRKEGQKNKEDQTMKPKLNEDHPDAEYHCGRLMAVLADLQVEAMKPHKVGAGVVQRFYAAASSTPGLVLGRLIRLAQFHIGTLERDKEWLADIYTERISAIVSRIGDRAPSTLTLEKQTLFALGYYQQIAQMIADKIDSAKKRATEATKPAEEESNHA